MALDHYDRLREQRHGHLQNAIWWKRRYQAWGDEMNLKWFWAEVRSHRNISRLLWAKGIN